MSADREQQIEICSNIEHVPPDALVPYEKNPRTHSELQVAQIARSIEAFGFNNPILVDMQSAEIIAGHGRLKAAKLLKLPKVPAIFLAHLTPAMRAAYVIADNRLAETAEWDEQLLVDEMLRVHESGEVALSAIGYGQEELALLLPELQGEAAEAPLPELPDGDRSPWQRMSFIFGPGEREQMKSAIEVAQGLMTEEQLTEGCAGNRASNALARIVREWLDANRG